MRSSHTVCNCYIFKHTSWWNDHTSSFSFIKSWHAVCFNVYMSLFYLAFLERWKWTIKLFCHSNILMLFEHCSYSGQSSSKGKYGFKTLPQVNSCLMRKVSSLEQHALCWFRENGPYAKWPWSSFDKRHSSRCNSIDIILFNFQPYCHSKNKQKGLSLRWIQQSGEPKHCPHLTQKHNRNAKICLRSFGNSKIFHSLHISVTALW